MDLDEECRIEPVTYADAAPIPQTPNTEDTNESTLLVPDAKNAQSQEPVVVHMEGVPPAP